MSQYSAIRRPSVLPLSVLLDPALSVSASCIRCWLNELNCQVCLCRAVSGGVLYITGEATTSVTGSSTFGQGTVYIANSTFRDNQADIAVAPNSSSSAGASFTTYGTLQGGGGAIKFVGALLWIQHSVFDNNSASSLGGGILYQRSCTPVCSSDKNH